MFHFLSDRLSHQESGLLDSSPSGRRCRLPAADGSLPVLNTSWTPGGKQTAAARNTATMTTRPQLRPEGSLSQCSRGPEWALPSWLHLAKQALLNSRWPCSPAALSTQAREGLCPPETQQRTCDWWNVRLMIDSSSRAGGWCNWKVCFRWCRLQLQICMSSPTTTTTTLPLLARW